MAKTLTVLWMVLLVIGLLAAFPEYIKIIFANKIYTLVLVMVIFLISFAIFLKMNNR